MTDRWLWARIVWARVTHAVTNDLPWWLAWKLPRKVALFAFVRVYGVLGECGQDYQRAYQMFERGAGK